MVNFSFVLFFYDDKSDYHYGNQADLRSTGRSLQHTVTDRPKGRRGGAIITCHPSRHHVHLGRVWLQHAIQLLLGCRVGRKVDGSVAQQRRTKYENNGPLEDQCNGKSLFHELKGRISAHFHIWDISLMEVSVKLTHLGA